MLVNPFSILIQGYVLTESAAVGTRGFDTKNCKKYESARLLAPNMEAKVLDQEAGTSLPPEKAGELWLQGPAIMKGQVAPADLETVLTTHTEIIDAAVTSAMDVEAGEIPVAFVVRGHGSNISSAENKICCYEGTLYPNHVSFIPMIWGRLYEFFPSLLNCCYMRFC
ncbi:4-coumarate--CoA ligase-like 3 [Platanthera zijinensis]|uniref:4-coumarate--CoA ligase n=1 Tax=Platanthera zijinensis TaxID=2320716 RepID=A0AAP0FYG6_9ASPA